jgi:transcriptional regulator with XRE-family HTH domain
MSLGAKLNELRMRKGESLQQTADAIDITKTHIWELEKGKTANPSAELLRKLADHFKVTVDYLIDPTRDGPTSDDEAMVFYRDLKSLDPRDQITLKQMMEFLKGKKD